MSEMQEMIMGTAVKMMEKFSTKKVVNDAENGIWAKDLWGKLEENGMLTVAIPEELGGNGGDYSDALSILRIAGKYSAPIPLAETYIANWILTGLGEAVTDEIITISCTKDQVPIRFIKNRDQWIISGKIKNVPWARFAQKILVFGETTDGPILSLVSLENAEIIEGQNLAGEVRDDVVFNQIFVDNLKIIPIDMREQQKKLLYAGAMTRSVMMAGALDNTLYLTSTYTTERSQFGRPIHRFQAIQHQLAQLSGETAAANVATNCAITSFEKEFFAKEIAFSKMRVNEASGKVSSMAHQVLAAIGFTYEHTLHHSTRRLWSWRDEFGTESYWEQIITEELMRLRENELWLMITGYTNTKVGL